MRQVSHAAIAHPHSAGGLTETARMPAYPAAHSAQCGAPSSRNARRGRGLTTLAAGRTDPGLLSRLLRRPGLLPDRAPAVIRMVPPASPPPPCLPSPTTSTITSPTAPAPPPTSHSSIPYRQQRPRRPGDDPHQNPAHQPHRLHWTGPVCRTTPLRTGLSCSQRPGRARPSAHARTPAAPSPPAPRLAVRPGSRAGRPLSPHRTARCDGRGPTRRSPRRTDRGAS